MPNKHAENLRTILNGFTPKVGLVVALTAAADEIEILARRLARSREGITTGPGDLLPLLEDVADVFDEDNRDSAAKTIREAAARIELLEGALGWVLYQIPPEQRSRGYAAVARTLVGDTAAFLEWAKKQ
jgi:hypothetical protein